MDKIPNSIIEIINKFLHEARKESFSIDGVYLFGSYAKGNFNKYSDIDIVVISTQITQ